MAVREIIRIDEALCDGCGDCVVACEEAALKIIDGKARLVSEVYCDGLGACLGNCPTGALTIEKRDAVAFDEEAVESRLRSIGTPEPAAPLELPSMSGPGAQCGCPGSASREFTPATPADSDVSLPSALTHWPVQLRLIRPDNPVFHGADILVAADCTAFAHGGFHRDLLDGRRLIVACPKLDDPCGYVEKLSQLFSVARPRSVTVARMQVPCCQGILQMVLGARNEASTETPVTDIIIGVEGEILAEEEVPMNPPMWV